MEEQLMTAAEVSDLTRFPVATLAYWRGLGKGPTYIKVGRWVRYRRSDIDRWIDENVAEQAEANR